MHQLGSAFVLGTFTPGGKPKKHDLTVSTYQACILLEFNAQESLTFTELQQHLNISAEELKRCAHMRKVPQPIRSPQDDPRSAQTTPDHPQKPPPQATRQNRPNHTTVRKHNMLMLSIIAGTSNAMAYHYYRIFDKERS